MISGEVLKYLNEFSIRGRYETNYLDSSHFPLTLPFQPLHVPVLRVNRRQLARNRLKSLDNVGEGREVSLTLSLVGCVRSLKRTYLMRLPC